MSRQIKKLSTKVFFTVATFFTMVRSASANWIEEILGGINTPEGVTIPELITRVLNWGIGFAALAAVAVIIVAGLMYITASGDEAKIGKATKTLTFAIIGLVVCFIAVMIVNFVLKTFLEVELG